MRVPRRAGTYEASIATASSTSAAIGERGWIARLGLIQQRLQHARRAGRGHEPDDDADHREHEAWPITMRNTIPLVAPMASRTPISCVRCPTEYAITP